MSHWRTGKLALKCSMAVLRRALLNIMPEWEGKIQTDDAAGLSARDMSNRAAGGMKIVVRKGRDTGLTYCDLGLKQNADGTWEAQIDTMGLPAKLRRGGKLEDQITNEVAKMKERALAQQRGYNVVLDTKRGNSHVIQIDVPIEDAEDMGGFVAL